MKYRDFPLLTYALGVSTYANHFGSFLLSWMVYELTGSKLAMGTLWFSIIIGQLMAQFLIGPYLDRWRRKNIMLISETLRLFIFCMLMILILTGTSDVAYIYAAAFIISIAFFEPAANALVPSLVREKDLIKANGKITSVIQMTRIFGVLSAGLVAVIGITLSILFVILLLFISMILILLIDEKGKRIYERTSWCRQLKKGCHIYLRQPILIYLGVFIAVSNFSIFAAQVMYLPFVIEHLNGNALSYGVFAAAWPAGYILGAVILNRLPPLTLSVRINIMTAALIIGGATFIMLAFAGDMYTGIFIELLAGLSGPFWNVYSTHLYQVVVPEDIRAQVFSLRILISRIFAPLGILFGTAAAALWGIGNMFIIIGTLSILVIIIVYFTFLHRHTESFDAE